MQSCRVTPSWSLSRSEKGHHRAEQGEARRHVPCQSHSKASATKDAFHAFLLKGDEKEGK